MSYLLGARGTGQVSDAGFGGVQPADLRLRPEDQRVQHDQERDVGHWVRLCLAVGVSLQLFDGRLPLPLQHLGDVQVTRGHRQEDLDRQLISRRSLGDNRRGEPLGKLPTPAGSDLVRVAVAVGVDGFDQPVALKALERRVDLTNVQRPLVRRPALEVRREPSPPRRSACGPAVASRTCTHTMLVCGGCWAPPSADSVWQDA